MEALFKNYKKRTVVRCYTCGGNQGNKDVVPPYTVF